MSIKTCILLFVKYPMIGQVKVRLTSHCIPYNVVDLYSNFVLDMLSTLKRSPFVFYVVYHPPDALEKFRTWLGKEYCYLPQKGKGLGERLKSAFQTAFSRGFQHVIALASDVPDLCLSIIRQAFQILQRSRVVIGPSPDGGYYLIGFQSSSFDPTIFDGIYWSTEKVFSQTWKKLRQKGHSVGVLPPWGDVDTVTELQALIQRSAKTDFRSSYTLAYLRPYFASLRR